MTHHSDHQEFLSHEELKYREHVQRANDFLKIELFRSAREEFKRALAYTSDDTSLKEKIEDCNLHIRQDARKIYVIVPIVLAVIAAVLIFG